MQATKPYGSEIAKEKAHGVSAVRPFGVESG